MELWGSLALPSQTVNILLSSFPSPPIHFSRLRSTYPPQYTILKHPQSVSFPLLETPSFILIWSSRLNYSIIYFKLLINVFRKQIVNWVIAKFVQI